MNMLIDQLSIRLVFALFICLLLFIYKHIHNFCYPSVRKQLFNKIIPTVNSADSLHLFSRIIAIGIIFSGFEFHKGTGLYFMLVDFFVIGLINFVLFLLSLYIMESIVLYNFEYHEEVIKQKNMCYSTIVFIIAISVSMIMRSVNIYSNGKIIALFALWLLAMVLLGGATKIFKFISKVDFNESLRKKSMALALSYGGFLLGCAVVIMTTLGQEYTNVASFSVRVFLRVVLAIIIFPIFRIGLQKVFSLNGISQGSESNVNDLGYGIYDGTCFFTSCFFTSLAIGPMYFTEGSIIF